MNINWNELTRVVTDVCVVREVDCPLVDGEHGAWETGHRVGHLAQEHPPPRLVMVLVVIWKSVDTVVIGHVWNKYATEVWRISDAFCLQKQWNNEISQTFSRITYIWNFSAASNFSQRGDRRLVRLGFEAQLFWLIFAYSDVHQFGSQKPTTERGKARRQWFWRNIVIHLLTRPANHLPSPPHRRFPNYDDTEGRQTDSRRRKKKS